MNYDAFVTKQFSAIMFGKGMRKQIGKKLAAKGVRKALIITDSFLYTSGTADGIAQSINREGIETVIYAGAQPENPAEVVEECAAFAKKKQAEAFVGVGGGSVMDLAKTARILMSNPSPISTYYDMSLRRVHSHIPMILVPTTAGTSSEISHGAMVYDKENQLKRGFTGEDLAADIACVDPELCRGMPAKVTATVGMDCFCHVAESVTCAVNTNPLTMLCAKKALSLIKKSLPKAIEDGDDMVNRNNMSLACVLAGIAFESCPPHMGHSLGHTVGAMYHIPHGEACGVFLAPVIKLAAQTKTEQVKMIGETLGVVFEGTETEDMIGKKTSDEIRRLYRQTGCRSINEIIDPEDIEKIAEQALADPSMRVAPVHATKELIVEMIKNEMEESGN